MERGAGEAISPAERFELDGLEFVPSWDRPSQPGSLTLLKSAAMVEAYRDLLAPYPHPRMVELGISQGGSVGLLALMAQPTRFVAVELSPDPIVPLVDALAERGLGERVTTHFGVDQGDQGRLRQIVDDAFGDSPLDVVIDDASHLYAPTVASFEVLFPRLRPGGVYVIEDWNWRDLIADGVTRTLTDPTSPRHDEATQALEAHLTAVLANPTHPDHDQAVRLLTPSPAAPPAPAPAPADEAPLSRLALELALARAGSGGAVADLRLDENWIVIHRGHTALDPRTFRLADLYRDHHQLLTPLADR